MPSLVQLLKTITGSSRPGTSEPRAESNNSMFHHAIINQITGGNFQMGPSVSDVARDLLAKHIAPNALPDSDAMYNAPKCYPATRKAINRKLSRWIQQQDDCYTKFIWLQGGAGAGKSAIMRTLAMGGPTKQNSYSGSPHVLGSFFFSRQDGIRNTALSLVPTLAFQLCKAHPVARNLILQIITDNRELIFTESLRNQVLSLLVRPLSHLEKDCRWLSRVDQIQSGSQLGRVFIIDGLDECELKKQVEIIDAFAILVQQLPIRVLLASRPEKQISSAINNNSTLRGIYSELSLSDDPDSDDDIRLFLEESLKEVRERCKSERHCSLPDSWPAEEDINELVRKSSKHFIYASTAEKYIASGDERPDVALRVVLGLQVPRTGQPFEELDTLYRHILGTARFLKEVLEIASLCLLTGCYYVKYISYILGYSPGDIFHFLSDIRALVVIDLEFEPKVRVQHKSLQDFLEDKTRARDFSIGSTRQFHKNHLERYFELLDKRLVSERTSHYHIGSGTLVEYIGNGIAASPISDTTTEFIQQHPPRLIKFLISDEPTYLVESSIISACREYIMGIGQYDFEGTHVYKDSLKDLFHCQKEQLVRSDHLFLLNLRQCDIVIPLLLAGVERKLLVGPYQELTRLAAFDDPFLKGCQHHYPQHILRQIREEMGDADDKLATVTLEMLRLIVKSPGCFQETEAKYERFEHRLWILVGDMLKALTSVLPKVIYRDDIAGYAICQLPDLKRKSFYDTYSEEEMGRIFRRARREMDAYVRRGDSPIADIGIGNSYPAGSLDKDGCSGDKEEEFGGSSLVEYNTPWCRFCNKDWEV